MKRLIGFIGTALLCFWLVACGGGSSASTTTSNTGSSSSSSSTSSTSTSSSSSSAASTGAITIHMIGDSTMADYSSSTSVRPRYGWGEKFAQFFNSNVTINNAAASGRSSRSYYYESGKWDTTKAAIKSGDYVIIQFGHNDQKYGLDSSGVEQYQTYSTFAYCGDGSTDGEACTSSKNDTTDSAVKADEHSYYQFLKRYVTEIRALGGIPILVTPIVRDYFDSTGTSVTDKGKHNLTDVLASTTSYKDTYARGDYPAAMKALAAHDSVPVIDVTTLTESLIETVGLTAATSDLYYPDQTHLNWVYATLVAKMVATELKTQGILTNYLTTAPQILLDSSSGSSLTFADTYVGETTTKYFTTATVDLPPSAGTIMVIAPTGFKVSTDKTTWSQLLNLSYSGTLAQTIYVQFVPSSAGAYSGSVTLSTLTTNAINATIPVSGTGLAAAVGTASSGFWAMNDSLTDTLSATSTSLVTASSASLGSATQVAATANGTVGTTTYKVNRYVSTGITAMDSNRYVEFKIAPNSGTFTPTSFSAYMSGSGGSSTYVDVYYSTDGFATKTALATAVKLDTISSTSYIMTSYSYTFSNVAVASGSSLAVRVYPYFINTTATGKYLAISNVGITGAVSGAASGAIRK